MQHLKCNTRTNHGQSRTAYLEVPFLYDKKHPLFVEKMSCHLHCPLKEVGVEFNFPLIPFVMRYY